MKRVIKFLMCGVMVLGAQIAQAQNIDEERMKRDIAVAENVLNTLIKQEFGKRSFFPIEVRGSYRAGYGVTFSIPTDGLMSRNEILQVVFQNFISQYLFAYHFPILLVLLF